MQSRKRASGHLVPFALLAMLLATAGSAVGQVPLNPKTLTKFMDPLPVPGAMPMASPNHYEIGAWPVQQKLHSQLPPTNLYGYGPTQATASYPGATIVARKGVPITVRWTNHLPATHLLQYAFDPTIPRAQTTTGVPITPHVHGCEVEPQSDGGPMTWFTAGFAQKGEDWTKQVLSYPNTQLPATIWYHDHAFGYTRHNVYAGLAGFFVITDPGHEPAGLPAAPYDIGLAIQDRMFTTDGQLWYPNVGITPVHPVWIPEFFGDVILVNGKVWPYLNVEARKYRFRVLEGSNARFYSLTLYNRATNARGPAFYQIATDGGYLAKPVLLNDPKNAASPPLLMAPGERAEVIIDFSAYAPGTEFILKNTAKTPYPSGAPVDPATTGQVMLFRVVARTSPDHSVIPANLTTIPQLGPATRTRVMTLNEMAVKTGPIGAVLNGMPFDAPETEQPVLGTTEMWEIVNTTADTHPIHLHLVQFQIMNRQKFNTMRYATAFAAANPVLGAQTYVPVSPTPHLKGATIAPDPNERGWKDTFRMNPGEVTRVLVRFAPQDGSPAFAFDATAEPGYVWHCHILEHEENDMMRPYHLVAPVVARAKRTAAGPSADEALVTETVLLAPVPNPTQNGSMMRFALRTATEVKLDLYDVAGHRVRQIANGPFPAGAQSLRWDGTDDHGRRVGAGVYFLNLRADGVSRTMKLSVMN